MRGQRLAYQSGRKQRLDHVEACFEGRQTPMPTPLYSHDATWQTAFERGWQSVSDWDIYHATHQSGQHGLERAKALFRRHS